MVRGARIKPKHLAEKLIKVRVALGLSQNDLIRELGAELTQSRISEYERGKGEPSLSVLLKYARLAGICVEVLIDDEINLPGKLPAAPRHKI